MPPGFDESLIKAESHFLYLAFEQMQLLFCTLDVLY